MSLLDEQLIEEWLNRKGFFTIRGLKTGLGEIDLLAVRHQRESIEAWHIESQISFRPMGYIGGDSNARRRSEIQIVEGINSWVEKKFKAQPKVFKRNSVIPGAEWRYVLVHAKVRHQIELELIRSHGIETIPYENIIKDLVSDDRTLSSSVATNIVDLIRYFSENGVSDHGGGD